MSAARAQGSVVRTRASRNVCEHQERLAELGRGISHPLRVEIVRILANQDSDRPCICGDIVNALPLAQSTVSQHLKVLRETGWITGEADGTSVRYCLVNGILDTYRDLLERVIIRNTQTGTSGSPCIEKLLGKSGRPGGDDHV